MTEPQIEMESPLQSADVKVVIDGIVAHTTLRQTFINTSEHIIEAVYQFPLPIDAAISRFEIGINGQKYKGTVQGRNHAEEAYEEGITSGKRSFMLESLDDGLYQVNAGNLAPGEKAELELDVASLIFMNDGRWHYYLPTVIAEKYGHSHLHPANQPHSSLFADYPLNGTICFSGQQQITNLQSNTAIDAHEENWHFSARLDRTLMFSWASGLTSNTLYSAYSATQHRHYGIALLEAPIAKPESQRAHIQLVVDCSGSMTGPAINDAKRGISDAIEHLEAEDRINIIKFGNNNETLFSCLEPLTDENRALTYEYIDTIQANMGGTELYPALERAFKIASKETASDILLITDACLWTTEDRLAKLAAKARKTNTRIFCIGVGTGVDANFVERIAQSCNGNSLLLNPRCNMDAQIGFLINQIRNPRQTIYSEHSRLHWQHLPNTIFARSTVASYYCADELATQTLCSSDSQTPLITLQSHTVTNLKTASALIQIAALKRLASMEPEPATALATELQIVSEYTSYVFVDSETVEGADGLPVRKQAKQMMDFALGTAQECFYEELPPSYAMQPESELPPVALYKHTPDEFNLADTKASQHSGIHPEDIDELLKRANIDFDRKKQTTKTHASLFWLESNGLSAELISELSNIDLDETLLLPALLLWLDEGRAVLSKPVKNWCRAREKEIYAKTKFTEGALHEAFEDVFEVMEYTD